VLGDGACEQKVVIVSLTASACFQGRITGTLKYACNGGPAIVELGTRILYGTFSGGRISVCGSDRFVLDERKACSDGPELFSGLVGMEGAIDGPLSVRWEAVPLSRDPACAFTTCEGVGAARIEAIEP
jgi:hypothetical protein